MRQRGVEHKMQVSFFSTFTVVWALGDTAGAKTLVTLNIF